MNPSITEMIEAKVAELAKRYEEIFQLTGTIPTDGYFQNDIKQALTKVVSAAREEERKRIREAVEGMLEEDTEAMGWDLFFKNEGGKCCPGDDYGLAYKKGIKAILSLISTPDKVFIKDPNPKEI